MEADGELHMLLAWVWISLLLRQIKICVQFWYVLLRLVNLQWYNHNNKKHGLSLTKLLFQPHWVQP